MKAEDPTFTLGRKLECGSDAGEWWNGIHDGLKIRCSQEYVGSTPTSPTKFLWLSSSISYY